MFEGGYKVSNHVGHRRRLLPSLQERLSDMRSRRMAIFAQFSMGDLERFGLKVCQRFRSKHLELAVSDPWNSHCYPAQVQLLRGAPYRQRRAVRQDHGRI